MSVMLVPELEANALEAGRNGDRERASQLWKQVLTLDSDHPAALNALGNIYLAKARPIEALAHFERAAAYAPGEPAIWFNLAAARRAVGNSVAALEALEHALAVDPYFVQAIFQKANLLESAGRLSDAAAIYRDFLDIASPDARSNPRFEETLKHAETIVAADNRALRAAIDHSASPPSSRVARAVSILVGSERAYVAEPTFLTVPELPAVPFFERAGLPWLDELESNAEAIKDEALALMTEGDLDNFEPYVANPPGTPLNQWRDLDHSRDWSAFFLYKHGVRDGAHAARCPITMATLNRMPLLRLKRRGPNAFFSLLKPGVRIPPHTGVTNARATVHLGLLIPAGSGFRVGAETRSWQCGKAWIFDDSIEHEAWNESSTSRIVLIFDVWNPLLDATEKLYLSHVLDAYDARRQGLAKRDDF